MENKVTKPNLKKLLDCTLLAALLLSAVAISMANAASEEKSIQVSPNNSTGESADNPTLYSADYNSTTTSDSNSTLNRADEGIKKEETAIDDNAAVPDENSTLYTTQDTKAEENNATPYTAQTQPDYTAVIIGAVTLAAVAICVVLVVFQRRIKTTA